jgi:putative acetyltransferase
MNDREVFDAKTGMTIRKATNFDSEKVKDLVFAVLDEFQLESDPDETDSDLEDIEASYIDRGGIFEMIEDVDGRVLGTYGLYPVDDSTVELRKMYFVRELRSRGYGREILQRAIGKAREFGFSSMYLETASVLEKAVKLYESFGFRPVDIIHSKRCDQGFVLDLLEK